MKKLYLFLLLFGGVLPVFSQIPDVQVDRRIYLWDVTWSMQGHVKANNHGPINKMYPYRDSLDIWDGVAEFLKRDINNISNANTDLILLPFRTQIDTLLMVKANSEGKTKLAKYIDEAKSQFTKPTNTNIVKPLQRVMSDFVNRQCNNLVILLTDGKSNDGNDNQEAVMKLLSEWDCFAADNNAYLIYMMLNKVAEDEKLVDKLAEMDKGESVPPGKDLFEFIDIIPISPVRVNVTDSVAVELDILFRKSQQTMSLPQGVQMAVRSSDNAIITINEQAEMVDNHLKVALKYSTKELKDLMAGEEISIPLTLDLLNQDDILKKYNKRLILKNKDVELVLVNKIQKRLTIKIKK